jgi:prepilin-type N-terminal cleavage/methylation domain-containing protein
MQKGFTLIEILVVISLTILLSFVMVGGFSRNRVYLSDALNVLVGDIRSVQTRAASGTRYNNTARCGYGFRDEPTNNSTYYLYVGANSSLFNCSLEDRNYNSGSDAIILTKDIGDSRLEFKTSSPDVFFESPVPRTFINNVIYAPIPATISIGEKNKPCDVDTCKTVCIFESGKIEIKNGSNCI